MSSPYLVVFDDQYFVGSDKRRLRIDVPVFSMFLFGLALDLVSYARKLSQENNLGRGAIEKLLTTDPGAGQGTNK